MKNSYLTVTDQFCGAGGSSIGATRAGAEMMWYNSKCLDEQIYQGAFISKAAISHNRIIVGKAPFICGLTSLAVRLGNGSAYGGRFAMSGKSKRIIGQLVRCTQCGEMKPWQTGVFKSEKGKPRNPCIECDTKRRALNAVNNRQRERKSGRERMASWRKAHPEAVYEANRKPRSFDRELARERINRWRRDHPETRRIEIHARKTLKLSLPNHFRKSDWLRCLNYWGNRCCICGRPVGDGFVLAIEHWIALSDQRQDNPGTVPWNILPMCHARNGAHNGCNNAKWARDPIEWLIDYLGEKQALQKLSEIQAYFETVTPPVMEMILKRLIETLS